MKLNCRNILVILSTLIGTFCFGQDPQFSQFYSIHLYLNPALTGNTLKGRISTSYRNQWSKIPGAFNSFTFSLDHYFEKKNSGLGLVFIRDKAGSAGLQFNSIGTGYAYNFEVSRKLSVRAGIKAARTWRSIDYSSLIFSSQLTENEAQQIILPNYQKVNYFDFASGVMLYSKAFWFGSAIDHLNRPNQSLIGLESRLPLKFSMHGGYSFATTRNDKGKATTILTTTAIYKSELLWDQVDIGSYISYKVINLGVWYRGIPGLKHNPTPTSLAHINQDAIILMLGIETRNFLIGYSYDITTSKLATRSGGSHEIVLIYEYPSRQKPLSYRKHFVVPCAKF